MGVRVRLANSNRAVVFYSMHLDYLHYGPYVLLKKEPTKEKFDRAEQGE